MEVAIEKEGCLCSIQTTSPFRVPLETLYV
jgi:hypothetical protein